MTTLTQDINAIALTPAAIKAAQAGGADLPVLMATLMMHIGEKQRLIKEIQKLHPNSGGDAANYAAFSAMLAKL